MGTGPRHIGRRCAVTATAALTLAALLPATAGAKESSSRGTETSFISNTIGVTSSTGRHLDLYLDVDRAKFRHGGPAETYLSLTLQSPDGESHTWEVDEAPAAAFTYSSAGDGTVSLARRQFGGLGSIHLTIKPTGSAETGGCTKLATVHRAVKARGSIVLHTHSGWGTVGGHRHVFVFRRHNSLETDTGDQEAGCSGFGTPPCDGRVQWNSPGSIHGVLDGGSFGRKQGFIDYFTMRSLGPSYKVQFETDDFATIAAPTITTNASGAEQIVLRAGAHGLFTGSATLTSLGDPTAEKGYCKGVSQDWSASFQQGANPLTVHNVVGGDFTPNSSPDGADFTKEPRP